MTVSENTTVAPAVQGRRRKKPLNINRERRRRMEAIVESLVTLLDEMDGDLDLEPSLGGGSHANGQPYDAEGEDDNGIADQEGMAEQLTGEPSLGWTKDIDQNRAMRPNSLPWPAQMVVDGEQEHDGREGDEREPNGDEQDHDYRDLPCDGGEVIDQRVPGWWPQ